MPCTVVHRNVARNYVPTQLEVILTSPTTIMSHIDPYKLRAKFTHFRILVIGRANAGKTTLLQRVCNTTEDPCIYDDDKNLVSMFIKLRMNSASDILN